MFDSMKQLAPEPTAEYAFNFQMDGVSPTLIVKPATQANKPYFNQYIRENTRQGVGRRIKGNALVATQRRIDVDLYPKYVVTGWVEGTVRDGGQDVPFTQEACAAFVAALPDYLFDDLRNFCADIVSFATTTEIDTEGKLTD